MRRLLLFAILVLAACSREPAATEPRPEAARPPVSATAPPPKPASYEDAVVWLRTAPGFSFVLVEDGVRHEGEMTRRAIGAETVRFRAAGEEWLGEATPRGLVWKRRAGGSNWSEAPPPPTASRLFQRVTVGFDPQKKEGSAQLVSGAAGASDYRFTDANTGDVWQVRVRADGSIENITVGEGVKLSISPLPAGAESTGAGR